MLIPQFTTSYRLHPGIWVQRLRIPERHVWIRSAEIDLEQVQARLHVDQDLLRRSFHPAGAGYQPPQVNTGNNLPDWLIHRSADRFLPILACNALHTNFVRGNGFVIQDGRLVCKPAGTIPLDGDRYQPLDGAYTTLILSEGKVQVDKLVIQNGVLLEQTGCHPAISGPRIVYQGWNIAGEVAVRLPGQGQTVGDEINFLPDDEGIGRTSFTSLGINKASQLMTVSVFAGKPKRVTGQRERIVFQPEAGDGLTLVEMSDLMIHLGADEAILGGGSGDTQQYIQGRAAWCALPRPQAGRIQASGALRGLGAILAIYCGLTQNDLTG